jgi:hypothetical protein
VLIGTDEYPDCTIASIVHINLLVYLAEQVVGGDDSVIEVTAVE